MHLIGLITHLPPGAVQVNVDHLRALAPDARVAVAYGGPRESFEAIAHEDKVFVEDPDLRAPPITIQSYNELIVRLHERFVADDPSVSFLHLLEYDHIPLRAGFSAALEAAMDAAGSDFVGKNAVVRNESNWVHYLRYRDDAGFLRFLERHSVREDLGRMYGCLGSGHLMRRAVVEAFAGIDHYRPIYNELYLPTLVHHLGFQVDDAAALGPFYDHVRWHPNQSLDAVEQIRRDGAWFVHPFKDWEALPALRNSAPPGDGAAG